MIKNQYIPIKNLVLDSFFVNNCQKNQNNLFLIWQSLKK